ncbi:TPA: helix-turn-helix transcriptional regulator [Enterococcus faecium]|nr:helix-turn-helix transcriptional regulator [Enterococcus faecium]
MSIEETILLDTLRCRLNFLRTGRSLSQVAVSSALSIPLFKYRKYEEGEEIPSIIELIYIADFYDISVDYLIGRSETASKLK